MSSAMGPKKIFFLVKKKIFFLAKKKSFFLPRRRSSPYGLACARRRFFGVSSFRRGPRREFFRDTLLVPPPIPAIFRTPPAESTRKFPCRRPFWGGG